jgi:hypothetical protein
VKHSKKAYKSHLRKEERKVEGAAEAPEEEKAGLRSTTNKIRFKEFPVKSESLAYTTPAMQTENPFYKTSAHGYGSVKPQNFDLPGILSPFSSNIF